MTRSRRRFLAAVPPAVALAGCIRIADDGDDGATDANDGEDADDGSNGTGVNEEEMLVDTETITYAVNRGETDAVGLFSEAEADEAIDYDALEDEEADAVRSFVEETDFERSTLVRVAVRVPNLCYALDVESIDASVDGTAVRVRAVDESADDEMCAQAEYVPTALVRLVFSPGVVVPEAGSVTVVDADGEEQAFTYGDDA